MAIDRVLFGAQVLSTKKINNLTSRLSGREGSLALESEDERGGYKFHYPEGTPHQP